MHPRLALVLRAQCVCARRWTRVHVMLDGKAVCHRCDVIVSPTVLGGEGERNGCAVRRAPCAEPEQRFYSMKVGRTLNQMIVIMKTANFDYAMRDYHGLMA